MQNQNYSVFKRNQKTGVTLGAIALGITTLLLPGCNLAPTETNAEGNATTEDVAENGSHLVGQEITVRNTVEEKVGDNGFVVEAEGGERVLIINATGQPFQAASSDVPIQATGRVESFSAEQIQNKYGLELDKNLFANYENQPALVAASMALAPNPRNFYEAPEGTFENQQIAVEGKVRLLEDTNNAFALFEEGWADSVGVLVLGVDQYLQGTPINDGETVAVTGQARQVNEQVLREANLGWNDSQIQEFVEQYTNRPVIITDGVYPSAVSPVPGN